MKNMLKKSELILLINDKVKKKYQQIIPTEKIIRKKYKRKLNKEIDLKTPTEFSEKLQWLKLYWYDSNATVCADKYKVRDIVKGEIGKQYLNELLEVYDTVDQIDINKLPKSFVLKGTHGSGYNIVCKDKNKMNWKAEFKKMRRWLREDYSLRYGEWVYKDIKPRIICERFLKENDTKDSLTDYKIFCFNGNPTYCQVIQDRTEELTIDFYDTDWNHLEFNGLQKASKSTSKSKMPEKYSDMLKISNILSQNFPFARVDFYYVNNQIYFGEITFFPRSGFGQFYPLKWNKKIGDLLRLPTNDGDSSNS